MPRDNATVVVTVDVSTSMEATDVEPNRLDAAARAATRFVEGLPDGFNVGIVTFSGRTAVRAAPTADRATAMAALQDLELAGRTAIGEGVFTSLDAIRTTARVAGQEEVPAHIVLLSDGTNTTGRTPDEAAAAAEAVGIPVSTIAYGTPEGVIESQGRIIGVPVDEETLAELAEDSDGHAYTAQSSDELNEVYDDIQSSIGWRTETREVTPYVAAVALLTRPPRRRPVPALVQPTAMTGPDRSPDRAGPSMDTTPRWPGLGTPAGPDFLDPPPAPPATPHPDGARPMPVAPPAPIGTSAPPGPPLPPIRPIGAPDREPRAGRWVALALVAALVGGVAGVAGAHWWGPDPVSEVDPGRPGAAHTGSQRHRGDAPPAACCPAWCRCAATAAPGRASSSTATATS